MLVIQIQIKLEQTYKAKLILKVILSFQYPAV